ncbi:unnamed protein product, partial [Phaeothamnion confervicola]
LTVAIRYDSAVGEIRISDNSFGMNASTIDRAMTVGEPPPNPIGRSRYGMGMKTAACWLGDYWTIRTTQLGDPREYTVVVDVEAVASGVVDLPITETPVAETSHYTEIVVSRLNVSFKGRRIGKTKDFLASMYRSDLREGRLQLTFQGDQLKWESAVGTFRKGHDGQELRRDVSITVARDPKPSGNGETADSDGSAGSATVTGWVGVLENGSRSKAGFSMFHSNRMVRGFPDSWRPQEIFGQEQGTNNLVNQRVVGEFNLDAFPVTHTKDDILWSDEEQERVEQAIRDEVADLLIAAESLRTARSG